MTKAVTDLLVTAVALLELGENEALSGAIENLKALGDDAKGNTQEFKELKELVEKIDADAQRLSSLKELAKELDIDVTDESTIDELEAEVQAKLDEAKLKEEKSSGAKVSVKLNVRYADKMPGNEVEVSPKEAKRLIDNGFGVKA